MSDQERSPSAPDTARNVGTAPLLSWDGVWIAIPAYNEVRTIRALALAALRLCPRVMVSTTAPQTIPWRKCAICR